MNASALPTFLQIHFTQGRHLLRPVKLLAPCADLTSFVAAEAFTSMLSTSRSPFSPLDMTTAVSGRFLALAKAIRPVNASVNVPAA